jgi:hypothetical protein
VAATAPFLRRSQWSSPEVIAAVKFWIRRRTGFYRPTGFKSFDMDGYPKTKKLLDSVPDVDFPLNADSPDALPYSNSFPRDNRNGQPSAAINKT